jgi:hypothetical protein
MSFLVKFEQKLRDMPVGKLLGLNYKPDVRRLVQAYLDSRPGLKAFATIRAQAEKLSPLYVMEAAVKAVDAKYEKSYSEALLQLAEALNQWGFADTLAEAFVNFITTQKEGRGANRDSSEALPFRYFFHAHGLSSSKAVIKNISGVRLGIEEKFADAVRIDDFGWLMGSVRGASVGEGSPDGAFFIISVNNLETAGAVKVYIGECGWGTVSSPQMLPIPEDLVTPQLLGDRSEARPGDPDKLP